MGDDDERNGNEHRFLLSRTVLEQSEGISNQSRHSNRCRISCSLLRTVYPKFLRIQIGDQMRYRNTTNALLSFNRPKEVSLACPTSKLASHTTPQVSLLPPPPKTDAISVLRSTHPTSCHQITSTISPNSTALWHCTSCTTCSAPWSAEPEAHIGGDFAGDTLSSDCGYDCDRNSDRQRCGVSLPAVFVVCTTCLNWSWMLIYCPRLHGDGYGDEN